MPVLDTSFLIRVQAGDAGAQALLKELTGQALVVPPWVVVEFLTGHTGRPEQVLEELDHAFTILHTSTEWMLEAGRFRRELHQKRLRIRLPDFWIATYARLLDTPVVTQNTRHFDALGVPTRSW